MQRWEWTRTHVDNDVDPFQATGETEEDHKTNSVGAGYVQSMIADSWQHRHINLWTSKYISFIYLCY